MKIIDREQNVASLEEQLEQAVATYAATRAKIRELRTTLVNEAQEASTLKDITAELEKVESDVVKEHQRREAQARALLANLVSESPLLGAARELDRLAERLSLPDLPAELIPPEDTAAADAHTRYQTAQQELESISSLVRTQAVAITTVLDSLDQDLRKSGWSQARAEAKAAYDALLGTGSSAFDSTRLSKLNQDRTMLESRLARHAGTREEITRLETTASEQLAAVATARKAITAAREAFVVAHQGTMLKLSIIPMGAEIDEVERSLREALGVDAEKFSASIGVSEGARPDSLLRLFLGVANREAAAGRVRQRVLELIDATENTQGFGDLQNNLRRQLVSNPSRRESIETWFPEDRLKLEYRPAESSPWKSISQGSIGQQTAAVLSFLLSFGQEPLVIDQPEDDLDTRMIMSLIVEQVRKMKKRRQIVIVTHNPNIVVHGDADLVHAMVDEGGQVQRDVAASGGLQEKKTRQFICDVMEGGSIAFRKRFERMGREQ